MRPLRRFPGGSARKGCLRVTSTLEIVYTVALFNRIYTTTGLDHAGGFSVHYENDRNFLVQPILTSLAFPSMASGQYRGQCRKFRVKFDQNMLTGTLSRASNRATRIFDAYQTLQLSKSSSLMSERARSTATLPSASTRFMHYRLPARGLISV